MKDLDLLKTHYPKYKQSGLDKAILTPEDIHPLLTKLGDDIDIQQIGSSYLKWPIYRLTIGHGPIKVLMWSQMHGNESTATAALMDFLNYLLAPANQQWRESLEKAVTLLIIPMVNPDGATMNTRHNAQSIDLNRDAVALQSLEGQLLNQAADDFKPDFGFNLHDQNRYYTVGDTTNTATISLLAPAYNVAQEVNENRLRAMQLISFMNEQIQTQIPGCVGRYDDAYSYRSFGDSFAAKGISTILIESGHYPQDPHRQTARWLNFMLYVQSLGAITTNSYNTFTVDDYESIPMNHSDGYVDIKLTNVNVNHRYVTDFTVNFNDHFKDAFVDEVGDMSHQAGFVEKDMSDYVLLPQKGYEISESLTLDNDLYLSLLRQGYSYFIGKQDSVTNQSDWPLEVMNKPEFIDLPQRQKAVHMIFEKSGQPELALIHGQWIVLNL